MAFLLLCISKGHALENQQALLYSAKSKNDIVNWANIKYGHTKNFSLEIDDKKVFVVLADTASGTIRWLIHVYIYSPDAKQWDLLFLRYTNTSDVKTSVDKGKRNLLFISKSDKILFIQPFDTLTLDYQRDEQ